MDRPAGVPQASAQQSAGPLAPAPRDRFSRMRSPLVLAGVVGGLTLALHLRDPHSSGSWGYCPWLALTGTYCPGCGGLRAVNDLSQGDLVGALSSNLVFVVSIPLLLWWWFRWARTAWVGPAQQQDQQQDRQPAAVTRASWASRHTAALVAALTVVMVLFGVLRNVPFGSWLAP